jgi:hypothetical protein
VQGTKTDEPTFNGLFWIKAEDRPRYDVRPSLSEAKLSEANLSEDSPMLDVLMVALALGFFALSVGYAYACDRL